MISTVIIGVLASSLFVWMIWRFCRSIERAEGDPKYRRRLLIRFGTMYVAAAVIGIVLVAIGQEPIQSLAGLPVVALLAWSFFRRTAKVNVPPA
jgi:uncharacterized membrane protein YvlD (DUF360 family)